MSAFLKPQFIETFISNPIIFTSSEQQIILLFLCIMLDFITGILASWTESKTNLDLSQPKKYFIESAKLRLTVIKFVSYSLGILGAWGIETIFLIKKIPLVSISTKELTLTSYVVCFFCVIEIYSILFENIKRMGFDILQKSKIIISEVWKFYKTLKNGSVDN
ncbi:MAG: hypothetical protein DI539_00300 [Flavobacterium psychrophilum]|nr:MAG: hypothetical protein DI539_00300 [Flavobacterium psychrophilum]